MAVRKFACFAFLLLFTSLSFAWLDGWGYRTPVNISSPTNLTDYLVRFDPQIYNTSGLVGSWHFSEGTGTQAIDFSGNGNDGSLVGGPVWTTGKFGPGLQFEGVDDSVNVPDSSTLDVTNAITLEAWVETTNATPFDADAGPALSCAQILAMGGSTGDGVYTIDVDGDGPEAPFDVYCDMTIDGGGWTLVLASNTAMGSWPSGLVTSASTIGTNEVRYGMNAKMQTDYIDHLLTSNEVLVVSGSAWTNFYGRPASTWASYLVQGTTVNFVNSIGESSTGAVYNNYNGCYPYYFFAGGPWSNSHFLYAGGYAGGGVCNGGWGDNGNPSKCGVFVRGDSAGGPALARIAKSGAYGLMFDNETLLGMINSQEINASLSPGWAHIVLTYDRNAPSDQQKLYVNGVLGKQGTLTEAINVNSNALLVGSSFNGTVDEVRVYNRSLSADEVQAHYNASKARRDYADLRFTDKNGDEQQYWLESDKRVWVRTNLSTDNGTQLYMYYGNPIATSESERSAVPCMPVDAAGCVGSACPTCGDAYYEICRNGELVRWNSTPVWSPSHNGYYYGGCIDGCPRSGFCDAYCPWDTGSYGFTFGSADEIVNCTIKALLGEACSVDSDCRSSLCCAGVCSSTFCESISIGEEQSLDSTPPTVQIISPTSITYSSTSIPLQFTASDESEISECKYELNNTNTTLEGCQNVTITAGEGSNTLKVWASDGTNWGFDSVSFTVSSKVSNTSTTDSTGIAELHLNDIPSGAGQLTSQVGSQTQVMSFSSSSGVVSVAISARVLLNENPSPSTLVAFTISD